MYYYEENFILEGVQCALVEDCEFNTPIFKILVGRTEVIASFDAITIANAKRIAFAFIKGYSLNKTVGEFANRPHIKGVE